jgi:ribosome recycling factor
MSYDKKDIERRMEGAINSLQSELQGLRTGRASINLLDTVQVPAYGSNVPMNQVGSVTVMDSRMLAVNIWDKGLVGAADRAIRDAGLGLNPVVDGQNLRIPIPPLNEERRVELTKVAGKYAESARIAVRNVRRDGMDAIKKMEKDGEISEDELKRLSDEVQKLTDTFVKQVDETLKAKEEEIMQVCCLLRLPLQPAMAMM